MPGRNGGTLTSHPEGSNGGVHRGKDRFPRKHMARAQYMGALSGIRGVGPKLDKFGRVEVDEHGRAILVPIEPGRMLRSIVAAYQIVAERAKRGIGLDQFIRLQEHVHRMFKDDDGVGEPTAPGPRFLQETPAETPTAEAPAQEVRLLIGKIIPAKSPKETTKGRRQRLALKLRELLAACGWDPVVGSAAHTFQKRA